MKITTKQAVEQLIKELTEDEGYRYSWQANIAVQFQDAWQSAANEGGLPCKPEHIHEISNKAADSFLKLLCYKPATDESEKSNTCLCDSPRDMGYLDTSYKGKCCNCEKRIVKARGE